MLLNGSALNDVDLNGAGGGPAEVTPDVGVLTLTGFAPTVTATGGTFVFPDVGSLILTGFEPTVSATQNTTATPGAGLLVLTGLEPTVTATENVLVTPATGQLTLAGFAPTVTGVSPTVVSTDVGHLILTGYEPRAAIGIGTCYVIEDFEDGLLHGVSTGTVVNSTAHPDQSSNHVRVTAPTSGDAYYAVTLPGAAAMNFFISLSAERFPYITRAKVLGLYSSTALPEHLGLWLTADGRFQIQSGGNQFFHSNNQVLQATTDVFATPGAYSQIALMVEVSQLAVPLGSPNYSVSGELRVDGVTAASFAYTIRQPFGGLDYWGAAVMGSLDSNQFNPGPHIYDFDNVSIGPLGTWCIPDATPGEAVMTQLPLLTVQDTGADVTVSMTQLPLLTVQDTGPDLTVSMTQLPLILVRQRALGRIKLGYTIGLEVLTQ